MFREKKTRCQIWASVICQTANKALVYNGTFLCGDFCEAYINWNPCTVEKFYLEDIDLAENLDSRTLLESLGDQF